MDGVPLRVPHSASFQELKYSVSMTVPDYVNILQETEVSVSLFAPPCCSVCCACFAALL